MSQGGSSLSVKTLDIIYEQVLDNLKRSGKFDEMRVSLLEPACSNPEFKTIMDNFMQTYTKNLKLDQDRKILRANLDKDIHESYRVKISLNELIKSILVEKGPDLRKQFNTHAEEFLKNEFQKAHDINDGPDKEDKSPPSLPEDSNQVDVDMDLESSYGDGAESPKAPEFSPISIDANDPDHLESENHHEPNQPSPIGKEQNMTNEQKPSLENIPIPPEEIPIPSDEEPPTPVLDELSQNEHKNDADEHQDDEVMTFSSISSVHTNELSDFEDSINLSDDEAKIVGQPIKSRMKIEELQKNINGLHTMNITRDLGPNEPSASIPCETSESDACSESAASGRRVARQRKSNPRYISEHFTS